MAAVDPSFPDKICNLCFKYRRSRPDNFLGFIQDRAAITRGKNITAFNAEFLDIHFPGTTMADVAAEARNRGFYFDPDWGVPSENPTVLDASDDDDDDDAESSGDEEVLESGGGDF